MQGALTVSRDTSSPNPQILTPVNGALLGNWRFSAQNKDLTLRKLTFSVRRGDGSIENAPAANFATLYLKTWSPTLIGTGNLTGKNITFDGLNETIPANGYKILGLYADTSGSGTQVPNSIAYWVFDPSETASEIIDNEEQLPPSRITATNGAASAKFLYHNSKLVIATTSDSPSCGVLVAVREEMIACGRELRLKENEGAHFEEQFWRDFSRSMLNGAKEAVKRVSLVLLFLAVVGHTRASAADRINVVVAIDLTASVSAVGPDSKAEFDKNLAAAGRLLAQIPAGTHITVLGITEQSFSQPYMLLSAELSPDEGYFKERLTAGRNQVVSAWRQRTVQLAARAKQTDLLGAVTVASQLFQQDRHRNILVIFSDMRHYTAALDLERPNFIAVASAMAAVEKRRLIPNLKDVEVYVLGVDGAGKPIGYWQDLRDFWQAYFKKAGANVRTYTILREVPALQ